MLNILFGLLDVSKALRAFKSWFKIETAANFRAFGNDPKLSFLHNAIYRMEL